MYFGFGTMRDIYHSVAKLYLEMAGNKVHNYIIILMKQIRKIGISAVYIRNFNRVSLNVSECNDSISLLIITFTEK